MSQCAGWGKWCLERPEGTGRHPPRALKKVLWDCGRVELGSHDRTARRARHLSPCDMSVEGEMSGRDIRCPRSAAKPEHPFRLAGKTWACRFFDGWSAGLKWQRLNPFDQLVAVIERHGHAVAACCRSKKCVSLGFVEESLDNGTSCHPALRVSSSRRTESAPCLPGVHAILSLAGLTSLAAAMSPSIYWRTLRMRVELTDGKRALHRWLHTVSYALGGPSSVSLVASTASLFDLGQTKWVTVAP